MAGRSPNAAHQEAGHRSNKAEESSRLRSLRRDTSRASFFLANNLFRLIAPVLALPTSNVTTTNSSTDAAPSTTSSAGANRDSSFQVLADGTQDIAALVGIFATDSVERYAIDYSKGYLATAVAHLSLLGLLGYVRLLVKLGLGADGCRKSGFDMKALRPMFGVQDEDHVPKDAVHEVVYMQRKRFEEQVHWSVVKNIKHTEESFQLLRKGSHYDHYHEHFVDHLNVDIVDFWLYIGRDRFASGNSVGYLFLLPLLSMICSALTCFPIMIFDRPPRHHSWTYYYATFGLFCSIVIATVIWMHVHFQEHHPRGLSDWTVAEHLNSTSSRKSFVPELEATKSRPAQEFSETSSLGLKDTFAFSRAGNGFEIYDVSVADPKIRTILRVSSFLLSGSILIGYACQYIEVRRLNAIESGYWLLIQGALAFIRVIIWVWDPSWDDSLAIPGNPEQWSKPRLWDYDLTETRLAILWGSLYTEPPKWLSSEFPQQGLGGPLRIPKWALPAFRPCNQNPDMMFELAQKLRNDNVEWDESFRVLQNAEDFWDIPAWLFMSWVFAWPNSNPSWVDLDTNFFSCRVIRDKEYTNNVQRLHFLPCFVGGFGEFRVLLFRALSHRNRCVFVFERRGNYTSSEGSLQQRQLVVGCDTPIPGKKDSSTPAELMGLKLETAFQTMDLMWETLDPMLKTNTNQTSTTPSPTSPTKSHAAADPHRISQQASTTSSAMERATLPGTTEAPQPDADITRPQRRRTN